MSKKPFMSHFKTLSWKQEALFCQELADAWAELSILPLWSLHSLKIKKSFRGDNPRGRGKVTVGFHDFHSNSFSFMPFSQYSICVLVTQSRPTLCNPRDRSPPGFPVPGILQARTLLAIVITTIESLGKMGTIKALWRASYRCPIVWVFTEE